METKFKVGQKITAKNRCIMSDGDGKASLTIGKEYEIIDTGHRGAICVMDDEPYPHWFDREDISTFFHIDPPRTLTDKWRDGLRNYISTDFGIRLSDDDLSKIESILSQPEPEKYQPKNGESVLVRDYEHNEWVPGISTGVDFNTYGAGGYYANWKFCRPFSPDLVGKVTE